MRITSRYFIMSVYSLLVSAPHIDGVRTCLAVLCKERRFGESLTHPQLQEILGALEDHEERASLTEEIGDIKKDSSLSYRLGAGEFFVVGYRVYIFCRLSNGDLFARLFDSCGNATDMSSC